MPPRHHPRTLFAQAHWRILRRRARLSGKSIEEILEEEKRAEGLTIEPAPGMSSGPGGMAPADIEALIRQLVPAITQGVRSEVADGLKATLERVSREASQQTGAYIAQEVARRLAAQGVAAAAPAGAPAAPAEPAAPQRIAIGDIQSLIDALNQQQGPQTPKP